MHLQSPILSTLLHFWVCLFIVSDLISGCFRIPDAQLSVLICAGIGRVSEEDGSEPENVTSEKYQILRLLRVVLCTVNPVHRYFGSCDNLQLCQLLPELRNLTFLLFRIFVSEGVIHARRTRPWPHVDHGVFQLPKVLLFVLVFGVLDAEESIELKVLVTRFPCLPLTLLGSETFVLGLSSLLLLYLLQKLSQKLNME